MVVFGAPTFFLSSEMLFLNTQFLSLNFYQILVFINSKTQSTNGDCTFARVFPRTDCLSPRAAFLCWCCCRVPRYLGREPGQLCSLPPLPAQCRPSTCPQCLSGSLRLPPSLGSGCSPRGCSSGWNAASSPLCCHLLNIFMAHGGVSRFPRWNGCIKLMSTHHLLAIFCGETLTVLK